MVAAAMGQPITVTEKPGDRDDVVRFDLNRSLTGMGHERYRADREIGSCAPYFAAAPGLAFQEIVLDTGRGHAIFYNPERVWVDRLVDWARNKGDDGITAYWESKNAASIDVLPGLDGRREGDV